MQTYERHMYAPYVDAHKYYLIVIINSTDFHYLIQFYITQFFIKLQHNLKKIKNQLIINGTYV